MVECEKCRLLNEDGSKFCTHCGEKLPDISITENNSIKHHENTVDRGFGFNLYYLSAFICFILGIIAFFISINADNGRSLYDRTVFDANNNASGVFYLASGIFMSSVLIFLGKHKK